MRLTIAYANGINSMLLTTTDATGHYSFGSLLADENYNRGSTDGADGNPVFTISVVTPTGYTPTTVDVNGNANDKQDADNHNGVTALPCAR